MGSPESVPSGDPTTLARAEQRARQHRQAGQWHEAERAYRAVLQIKPDHVPVLGSLGDMLKDLARHEEACHLYQRLLQLRPDCAEAYSNLGVGQKNLGRYEAAEASYRRALQIKPALAETRSNLADLLRETGRLDEAMANYRLALLTKPDYAQGHNNFGLALNEVGAIHDAHASFQRAVQSRPEYAQAHSNLANTLKAMGHFAEAEASYRRALQLKPDFADAHSNLLFTLNYHPDKSGAQVFEAYREYERQFGQPYRGHWRPHTNNPDPQRRLKVGYVSPALRQHSSRHFLEPLLAHHDKTVVEVVAYAELNREDAVTARYKGYFEHWVPTKGMSDDALAERIRADGIDILVDVAGHTAGNRLQVFARKPAPVSLHWLDFGYTTGLEAIDYYLTDWPTVPQGSEALFSEEPWRLDGPGLVYRPAEDMGQASELPALKNGHITFGTLTRAVRINHHTVRVWAQLLHRVPGSRLVVNSGDYRSATMQQALSAQFAAHGIDPQRLDIGHQSPPWDVLRGIDIGLDCFPHNSGTTLFESLYLGVPFVTLAGRASVGRMGCAILSGLGRPEWVSVPPTHLQICA